MISHQLLAEMCVASYQRKGNDLALSPVNGLESFARMVGSTLVLCWRGTNSLWDLFRDCRVYPVQVLNPEGGKMRVHAGFYRGAYHWHRYHLDRLMSGFDFDEVCLTGHSLGAAVASQLAMLAHRVLPITQVTLFGEPKGFFESSRQYYQDCGLAHITTSYRQGQDKVTWVPPWGQSCVNYTGIGQDVFYDHDITLYAELVPDGY